MKYEERRHCFRSTRVVVIVRKAIMAVRFASSHGSVAKAQKSAQEPVLGQATLAKQLGT